MIAEQLTSIVFIGLLLRCGGRRAAGGHELVRLHHPAGAGPTRCCNRRRVVSDELTYARDVEGEGTQAPDNPLYFTSPTRHETSVLQSSETGEDGIWLNAAGEQSQIVPGTRRPRAQLAELSYNADNETWSFRITIIR